MLNEQHFFLKSIQLKLCLASSMNTCGFLEELYHVYSQVEYNIA